jgi:hypothetical protein
MDSNSRITNIYINHKPNLNKNTSLVLDNNNNNNNSETFTIELFINKITNDNRLILISIVSLIIILADIMLNLIVILSIAIDKSRKRVDQIFMSNAVADFLIGFIVMPMTAFITILNYFPFNSFVCFMWTCFDFIIGTSSMFHIVFISYDRYKAVSSPIKYTKKNAVYSINSIPNSRILASIWFLSFTLWTPLITYYKYIEAKMNKSNELNGTFALDDFLKSLFFNNTEIKQCYLNIDPRVVIIHSIFVYYIPITMISIFYIRTMVLIWRRVQNRNQSYYKLVLNSINNSSSSHRIVSSVSKVSSNNGNVGGGCNANELSDLIITDRKESSVAVITSSKENENLKRKNKRRSYFRTKSLRFKNNNKNFASNNLLKSEIRNLTLSSPELNYERKDSFIFNDTSSLELNSKRKKKITKRFNKLIPRFQNQQKQEKSLIDNNEIISNDLCNFKILKRNSDSIWILKKQKHKNMSFILKKKTQKSNSVEASNGSFSYNYEARQVNIRLLPNDLSKQLRRETLSTLSKREINVTYKLIFIMFFFIVCWLPFIIFWSTNSYFDQILPQSVYIFSFWLAYSNSIFTPVILIINNQKYRNILYILKKKINSFV